MFDDDDDDDESSTRFTWNEDLKVGHEVTWWADKHGQGLPAGHPGARERHGVIDTVHAFRGVPIAYGVTCNGLNGPWQTTLRPDYRHSPRRVKDAGEG